MSNGSTALTAPTDSAIATIRRAGAAAVAERKEIGLLSKQIAGLEWGNKLSDNGRYAIAAFARVTRANISIHIDILGGKPYLNAQYWADFITKHDRFHHYTQRDLSPSVEQALRDRAAKHLEIAGDKDKGRIGKAQDLIDQADDMVVDRARWSPRENATVVIETTIMRLINAAPLEAIAKGQITDLSPYMVAVTECNWAGGMGKSMADKKKYDPIGDANPGTTARSRSLRRCATKAFSAWAEEYDKQIAKAEDTIMAEFEIIEEQEAAHEALHPGEPMAVLGSGEPTAVSAEDAEELPVEGVEHRIVPEPEEEPEEEPEFDHTRPLKQFFATFRDAGLQQDERKEWAKSNGLPQSTKDWGEEEYERAQKIMMEPTMKAVSKGVGGTKKALKDLCLDVLKKEAPEYLRDWNMLLAVLDARAAGDGDDDDPDADL